MPAHPLALALLSEAQIPVAAPSANPFGYLSPTTAQHVHSQLADEVEIILDGGECEWGIESTIVDCPQVKLYYFVREESAQMIFARQWVQYNLEKPFLNVLLLQVSWPVIILPIPRLKF